MEYVNISKSNISSCIRNDGIPKHDKSKDWSKERTRKNKLQTNHSCRQSRPVSADYVVLYTAVLLDNQWRQHRWRHHRSRTGPASNSDVAAAETGVVGMLQHSSIVLQHCNNNNNNNNDLNNLPIHIRAGNGSLELTHDPLTHLICDPWPIRYDPWPITFNAGNM